MSGLAGRFFTGNANRSGLSPSDLARMFAGPNCSPQFYTDDDVLLLTASRFMSGGPEGSFAEIITTDQRVLALEGYVLNLADLTGDAGWHRRSSRAAVVLDLVAEHGAAGLVERLIGAYNLVIWNRRERTATVATGKFGQRTMYTFRSGDEIIAASDLQVLRALSTRAFELDPDAICTSFMYGAVYGSATPLAHVRKLFPGSTLSVQRGQMVERPATDLALMRSARMDPGSPRSRAQRRQTEECVAELDDLMRRATARLACVGRTHAVMIGSGVDSSVVAAYAKGAIPSLTALTQQMPGELDEATDARRIVDALGIPHRVASYTPAADLVSDVAAFVRIAEEPAYWNQLGPALLRMLRAIEDRPESFLTGAEGDLLFHFRVGRPTIADVIRSGVFRPVAEYTIRRLVNRVTRRTYIIGSDFDLLDRRLMSGHITASCGRLAEAGGYFDPSHPHLPGRPNAQRHLVNNGWQNVRIISQLGQDAGCEVLFPYLDDDVASCVLTLPEELKINKILLRLLLRRFLSPSAVPDRKRGYWAHLIQWHYEAGTLRDVLEVMSDRRTIERGVYDRVALARLVDAYVNRIASGRLHPVLWQLLLFEMFCREYIDRR